MDWERIKTLLIISLIITNGLLGFFVYTDYVNNKSDKLSVDDMIEYMESEGIYYKTDLPPEQDEIKSLYVKFDKYSLEDLTSSFLQDNIVVSEDEEFGIIYSDGTHNIMTDDYDRILIYEEDVLFRTTSVTKDEAIKISNNFLIDHGYHDDSLYIKESYNSGEGFYIIYGQKVQDGFIDGTYMQVKVNRDRVIYFERKWVEFHEEMGNPGKQRDTADLLFDLVLKIRAKNYDSDDLLRIINIELGYDIDDTDDLESGYVEGEKIPYFKFTLSNNDVYKVEAFEE